MELTAEQKVQIEEIANGLNCPKDLKCADSGFDTLCKAMDLGFDSVLECMAGDEEICKFRVRLGEFNCCTCPLRSYIAKNLKK